VTLLPGCPLVVAPSFHLAIDWRQRLLVGAGIDRVGQGHVASGPWRPPDEGELDLLVPTQSLPNSEECLCVFKLPQHLLSAWWQILERSRDLDVGNLDGFEEYVAKLAEFLAYKNLAVPDGATFELLVSAPGLCSIQRPEANPGLKLSWAKKCPDAIKENPNLPPLWGGLNLGEEAVSLVLLNLTASDKMGHMRRRHPNSLVFNTFGELADRFLTLCPDYKPVRLRIEPGEGFRLPAGGMLVDACTLDNIEPAVLLWIASMK
jgi:hypothetical protein